MVKHATLVSFLLNLNLFAAEQLDPFVDDMTISPAGRPGTAAGQIVICEMDYTAVLFIERYPHAAQPVPLLLAQISAWLKTNDPDRQQGFQFPINVDVLDDATADLEIRIVFHELVTATTNASGAIMLNGSRYALDA